MGMTDKQFNGFVRFLLDDIKEVIEMMRQSKQEDTRRYTYTILSNLGIATSAAAR